MFKRILPKLSRYLSAFKFWNSHPMNSVSMYKVLGLICLGIMSRLLPHPPNCTAINAIALFGIGSFGSLWISLFSVFSAMLLSDLLVFGFHSSIVFVYLSVGLIVLMGYALKSKRSLIRTTFLLAVSSLLFFIVSNFGVWLMGSIYPKTVIGLELCYVAAVPFLANNLMGTLLYGGILFGWLALTEQDSPALAAKGPIWL